MDYPLAQRLDAFVRGESAEQAFIDELCAACAETPDLAWDALAITDQYQRRGKISVAFSETLRLAIVRPALAKQNAAYAVAAQTDPAFQPAPSPVSAESPEPVPAPEAPAVVQGEVQALRRDLDSSREALLRYRKRMARVVAFGHRQREALRQARQELKTPAALPQVHHNPESPPVLYLSPARLHAHREPAEPPGSIRPWQVAAAVALFLTISTSSAVHDMPQASTVAAASAAPSAPPQIPLAPGLHPIEKLSLADDRTIVRAGDHEALIRVRRTGSADGNASFTWWTRPSGARSGADYVGQVSAVRQFPDGVEDLTLSVPIIANPRRRHTELFYVEIGHPGGGAVIGELHSTVVILLPDEGPGPERYARN